jgi:hypothetical protein
LLILHYFLLHLGLAKVGCLVCYTLFKKPQQLPKETTAAVQFFKRACAQALD